VAVTTKFLEGLRVQGRSDDSSTALSKTWLFDDAEAEEDNTTTWQVSGGNINVLTSSAYDASSYDNNLTARAYVELDADITDKNFTWDIDFSQDPAHSGNNYGGMFCLSNYADVRGGQGSGDAIHVMISMNASGYNARRIQMNYQADQNSKAGSSADGNLDQQLSDATVYYLRVKRTNATTVVTTIHSSDANRTAGTAMATNTMTIPSTLNSLDRISMAYGEDSGANGRMDYLKCFKMTLVALTPKDKSSITNMALGTRYEEVDTRKLFRFADNSPSLENLTWVSEKSLVYSGSDHSKPTGLWFKPDGTEFYVIGEQSDTVTQWSMSTANAWDITNASHTNTYDISGQESTPTGIAFSSDGTKMYICGVSGVDTNQYTLSTAWDISGTVTHNGTHSESSRDNAPYDITFGDNGMKFYIIGNQNRKIYQYALGSAYHITSGVSYTTEYNGSSTWGNATDVAFNSDGTRFFVTDQTNDKIFEYALSTAWFVNSASLTRNSSYSSKDNEPHGIQIGNSNANLFLLGWQNDKIHRYTCRSGEWKEKGTA